MPLDYKKEHTLYGGGAGKDIVLQIDEKQKLRLYERDGTEIYPITAEAIERAGLTLDKELRERIAIESAVEKELKLQSRLDMVREAAAAEARAKIEAGEKLDWENIESTALPTVEGIDELDDLGSLDDL